MIDVIVICNESNCNQCFILCTFQIIIHNVLTDQKVHWTKVQSFHPALNLTFGCDPRPWSLRNIKTLLCLVQFCSKLLDCLSVAKWNAVSLNMKKKIYRNSVCFGKISLLFKTAMSRTKYKVNVKCVHSILERMQAPIFHVSSSALFVIKSDLFFNLFYINLLWIPHCIHPYTFRQRCNMFRHSDSFHKFPDIFFQKRHLDTLNSVKHKEKPILQKTLLVLFQFLTRIIDFQHKIFS